MEKKLVQTLKITSKALYTATMLKLLAVCSHAEAQTS